MTGSCYCFSSLIHKQFFTDLIEVVNKNIDLYDSQGKSSNHMFLTVSEWLLKISNAHFGTFSTTCGGVKNKIYCCMCPHFHSFLGVDTLCIGVLEAKY